MNVKSESRRIEVVESDSPGEGSMRVIEIRKLRLCYGFGSDVTHAGFEIHTNSRSE